MVWFFFWRKDSLWQSLAVSFFARVSKDFRVFLVFEMKLNFVIAVLIEAIAISLACKESAWCNFIILCCEKGAFYRKEIWNLFTQTMDLSSGTNKRSFRKCFTRSFVIICFSPVYRVVSQLYYLCVYIVHRFFFGTHGNAAKKLKTPELSTKNFRPSLTWIFFLGRVCWGFTVNLKQAVWVMRGFDFRLVLFFFFKLLDRYYHLSLKSIWNG